MIGGLITIVGGLLAASGFIISRKPNAKELIDKIAPYAGMIGLIMFGWGVWETLSVVRNVSILSVAPLRWVFWAGVAAADLLVGFILGFGMISKYMLSKNAAALEKGQRLRTKLVKVQAPLGLFAMVMGVLFIVFI
ncbi:MAG: hypothetical protein JRH20_15550 [Deltaproteobacteria bacterium]|nr:hypothetical protein [Deltaproteobacteria bacterium]